jgi:hypothetical protein
MQRLDKIGYAVIEGCWPAQEQSRWPVFWEWCILDIVERPVILSS